jgi:hypothetical protein
VPSIEYVDRWQTAVLWLKAGTDRYGEPMLGAPIELAPPVHGVRWLDKRRDALDAQGNKVQIDGTVIVDRFIPVGSNMWLGTLDQWYALGSGNIPSRLCWVVSFDGAPDLKNRATRRTVTVKRFKDENIDG